MPKKKKTKNNQPLVGQQRKDSADSDVDSDSSDLSDEQFVSSYTAITRGSTVGAGASKSASNSLQTKKGSNVPHMNSVQVDNSSDALYQSMGFKKVGAKKESNGMGLDDFSVVQGSAQRGHTTGVAAGGIPRKSKSQVQASATSKLPLVNIRWPLADEFQFRLACKICFMKTGEGYKGYNYVPNQAHSCSREYLIIRRLKQNENLNWIKIRPFPQLFNNRFAEFKMCQQFANALPCKIGEMRCTFPHNNIEMKVWYMERDGEFSVTKFIEDLCNNEIDTSEQLAARQPQSLSKCEPSMIPGLNFTESQRLSSPAPVNEPLPMRPQVPVYNPSQFVPPPSPLRTSAIPQVRPQETAGPAIELLKPPASATAPRFFNEFQSTPPLVQKPAPSASAPLSSPLKSQPGLNVIDNPLKDYDFKVVCPQCFKFDNFPGRYKYIPFTHECEENVLAFKRRGANVPWVRVRERTNHREFSGKYIICNSVMHNRKELCRFGEGTCSFAHNEAEQALWGLEKDGRFSIAEFILQHRAATTHRGFSLNELLKKYGGYFTFICRDCYYGRPPRISEGHPNNTCTGEARHQWDRSKVLAHIDNTTDQVTLIDKRKFTSKSAFFRICKFLHFCFDQVQGTCLSAHSLLERDVWMLERDTDITREQLVEQSQRFAAAGSFQQQYFQKQQQTWGDSFKSSKPTGPAPQAQFAGPTPGSTDSSRSGREKLPHAVQEYCGVCWRSGIKSMQDGEANRCSKGHTNFLALKVVMILPVLRELRNLPRVIPRNLNFTVCRQILEKRKCQFMGSGPCQFAHSEEERVLWIWMARNKMTTAEEVARAWKEEQQQQKVKISHGDSVVAVTPARPFSQIRTPVGLHNTTHYCRYCSHQCNSDRQWEDHCSTEKHIFNVNSDKDHQWNFRQPPWGQGSNLNLCSKHMGGGRCQYSNVPDMFNLCKYAHSVEELDEWKERFEWRQMKRSIAKEQNMFSYMDTLLEEYEKADYRVAVDNKKVGSRVAIMSETLEGVDVKCSEPLEVYRQEKNAVFKWSFMLKTTLTLTRVALLHNHARLHFVLQCTDGSKQQLAAGELFEDVDSKGNPCYRVTVHFSGGMFGSFSQWVVFDFGSRPVLLRKLNVELGLEEIHDKVRDLRKQLAFDRWTTENREVIPYQFTYDEVILDMMRKYREPKNIVTQDSMRELNSHNYVHKMHRLLDLEEVTRHRIIASFNLVAEATFLDTISEEKGSFFAPKGELFMKLPLSENLTEDTPAGKLILTSVRSVLLALNNSSKQRVFEAIIVREENFNYDGRGKDFIYLSLAPSCVRELKLKHNMTAEVEVQFQMDRLHFVRMHYALDSLKSTEIAFPDVTRISSLNEQHTLRVQSRALNQDQMAAVRHIVTNRVGYTPPFVMYGPFGTGKTETLAQATMVLLRERPESRILICAQSNSAADLYIQKYLDPYLQKSRSSQASVLRIVAKERRIASVSAEVQKYCCMASDGQSFEIPTEAIIRQHHVVVTTVEMSLHLTLMNLYGYFTHIFVDEAGQVLECETLMPLTLATDKTCVVLTGDHMQISPKVYSAEARRQGLSMSMLERLYLHYQHYHQGPASLQCPLNIFLSINYRTKMEILRFISAVFYGGPDILKAQGNIPSVVELTPMIFYAVTGREIQDADSTSFYNTAEVMEVVERVVELVTHWPQEWGPVAPEEIGIVTPYHDQVRHIRGILRKRRLNGVRVETVQNMQGKEFRALFISIVRTRHLLESDHMKRLLQDAEAIGGIADFAFLSDPKLLNTALTRTQSVVAVVGDPVALCAIGECIQIWRTYLKHCTNMRSVHPISMNYEAIKNQVVHLQMSAAGRSLTYITDMCRNTDVLPRLAVKPPPLQNDGFTENYIDKGPLHSAEPLEGRGLSVDHHELLSNPTTVSGKLRTKKLEGTEVDEEFTIHPDEILLQLAQESAASDLPTQPHFVECVDVQEEGGIALVTYNMKKCDESLRTKMQSAAAASKELYEDTEIFSEIDKDTGKKAVYFSYTEAKLVELLKENPIRFKLCTISTKGDTCLAKAVDPSDSVQEVEIRGPLRRGHAFDGDEVVVEILNAEDISEEDEQESMEVQGQVIGIMQRAVNPRCRSFVCFTDVSNTSLLTPINPSIPRIYNVAARKHLQRIKRGYVVVYKLTTEKQVQVSHYAKVDPKEPEAKLFVVRYLKWVPGFFNPLGIVVDVLPAGSDLASALTILDIEYQLPRQLSSKAAQEVEELYGASYQLPADIFSTYKDMRDRWCFTINSADAFGLQQAYSIDQLSDATYELAVHLTDVHYFVEKGSALDREALRRGVSVAPVDQKPLHLLPERLSTDLCSFRPGEGRLALSVFMVVKGSGDEWHVTQTSLRHTVISSKRKFSLQEVEHILDDVEGAQNDYLLSCVLVLYQIALMQRKSRLGNAHLDPQLTPQQMTTPRAHCMLQEVMIMTNHHVARMLLESFPECTPLVRQAAPNCQKLEEWKSKHAADAVNSVALTRPFLNGAKTCTCRMVCMCVSSYMRDQKVKPLDHFDVITQLWNHLREAASLGNHEIVQKTVATADNHPQSSVALGHLHSIFEPVQLVCSGNVADDQRGHYSLNLPCFTSITNPLHSYIDIVVQHLASALVQGLSSPYSQLEIAQIVTACNYKQNFAQSFAKANMTTHLAAALQDRPLVLFPVIESLDEQMLTLRFPTVGCIQDREKIVALTSLGPATEPLINPDTDQVKLKWQMRIYDAAYALQQSPSVAKTNDVVELCADRFVSYIPPFQWQRLLKAIREENGENILSMVPTIQEHVHEALADGRFALDISSEIRRAGQIQHFAEFGLSFHSSMVVQVQVVAQMFRGLLVPKIQLFSLTPSLDICLEHRNNPTGCFAKMIKVPATLATYSDEAAYQQSWLPVLALEAAECAVHSHGSAMIHNVYIAWSQDLDPSGNGPPAVYGEFSLTQAFCKDRKIRLSGDSDSPDGLNMFDLERSVPAPLDLVCVRYAGLQLPEKLGLDEAVAAIVNTGCPVTWVGHCVVVGVGRDNVGLIHVRVRLHAYAMNMPEVLLDPQVAAMQPCSMEWIPRTLLYRQMEHAVACLKDASDLAKDIAVGRKPVENIDLSDVDFLVEKLSSNHILNPEQKTAVEMALKQTFTVLQGSPGTGKSFTVAHLCRLFVERNRMTPRSTNENAARVQVLICGPSDAAVDVAAVHLMNLDEGGLRMVRVYSEQVEHMAFPLPRDTVPPWKLEVCHVQEDPTLTSITLHHMIRQNNRFSERIKEFDTLFQLYPQDISDDQVQEYLQLVQQAQQIELRQAEVILATCSAAASPKMARTTNIRQIIIDDCGACKEPESLVPIILFKRVKQVVLVGDHKQLCPIVHNATARSLGLERSLLERYSESAIMLTGQYRMHQGISEISSSCFYDGRISSVLKTQNGPPALDIWPGSRAHPVVFCHLVGLEETVTVASEEGVILSKCNPKEADVVADIVGELVFHKKLDVESVIVVTQYHAQCGHVKQRLEQRGLDVAVTSILDCQGSEYDYVVLSTVRSVPRSQVERQPTNDWLERHLGVTADGHQINVAFTRARKGLILTGNKYLLQCHPTWLKLLTHFRQLNKLVDAAQFLQSMAA
ncbi:helicase with zinc finger domain 2-like isoform X5 [Pomacea canaliculata]|nr:helicase with zinc finger domain 2-like isoform X5 [Pomacea canaliculata]XP_025107314.1 helicase with zinc finger domain 2-like isoform X5 [Pomacea canaliculata]XP_025107391.1 helicase with zinc finger domain 2-like isoform X5 [Pomacea canaliculata]XP_025107470.1 helicase with zinc finger domain 2-like isoform X5 [Pomacea canaliculata]